MKKGILNLIILIGIVSAVACAPEEGTLSVAVKADKSAPVPGETVKFTLDVEDVKNPATEVSGNYYVYNDKKSQLAFQSFTGNAFSYKFEGYGTYTVKVIAKNKKNYGTGSVLITVAQKEGGITDWTLASEGNPNSFMAGDPVTLVFKNLKSQVGEGSELDVHIQNQKTEEVLQFSDNVTDTVQFVSGPNDKGNYRVVCVITNADGSRYTVEDQMILMDPNNPVEILVTATKNSKEYEDTVFVSGSAEHKLGAALTSVKLIRTARYGREAGVYPLASLNKDGGLKSSKKGTDYITITETYSYPPENEADKLFKYDPNTCRFEFLDPMNYYDENGNVEEKGFQWSYAKWDREVWKSVLRKEYFSMKDTLTVNYQIIAVSETSPDEEVAAETSGYPYLNKVSLCQILFWYKDAALNRLWHMQCPRWCWKKTSSWLTSAQKYADEKGSGEVAYSVSGTSGVGYIRNYSDWADVTIFTNANISTGSLSLSSNNRKAYSGSFTLQTDLYGVINMEIKNISVRDMVLQYGLWTDGGPSGTVEIKRNNAADTVSTTDLLSFMPTYAAGDWGIFPGNGYDEWDAKNCGFDAIKSAMTWTLFNFKYPPLEESGSIEQGNWGNRESDWSFYYMK